MNGGKATDEALESWKKGVNNVGHFIASLSLYLNITSVDKPDS